MTSKPKYFLFAGRAYYPGGGWEDFKGCFSSPEKALEYIRKDVYLANTITKETRNNNDWFHVVRIWDLKVVLNGSVGDSGVIEVEDTQ